MKIAFYKGFKSKNILDWFICLLDMGKYSHCEIIYSNISYSASYFDGGVRKKRITYNKELWDIYDIKYSYLNITELKKYHESTKLYKYDLVGLIFTFLFRIFNWNFKNKTYCSKWCVTAFAKMTGKKKYENLNISPNGLFKLIKKNGII